MRTYSDRPMRAATWLGVALMTITAVGCRDMPTPVAAELAEARSGHHDVQASDCDVVWSTCRAAARSAVAIDALARRGIVDITARGLALDGPAEIPSGWTTIRFHNESGVTHFAVLEKMPPGRTVADSKAEVVPIFQEGMNLLIAGRANDALVKFGELPAWFSDIVFTGGPGLTAPGRTSEVTVYLDPGTYVIECYVKTPDGEFHSYLGMIDQIVVTNAVNAAREPEPTMALTIDNGGITFDDSPRPGRHTVAVRFAEQQVHGNFLGSDIHLARIEDDTDLGELAAWMTWVAPSGLATPSPAEFVGGLHEMPAGTTGYIDVVLKPGRYAWIAEVDDPVGKNLFGLVTVPFGR